ncbi:MAG: glycosyltransferase [Candidatus Marinimicrobia bacterium]|jgi:cellulose synthase/poly-beta-1,6-N-acetylglucosamine synthase-like glycosyltransferase|nr:glycosyltransferase [Candidatus Neomarinimicrobiota bacterium]MBT3633057.1 glycosyltransferase [Candidatus Neomarinimicrobiota bacterium]MBT3758657.1 glycosyltransferase [Candidatus Neomarinimicrobiota bacterium]MBT3896434.1 glycosyltransferase [Candidatus Neomarinimicrobiota bacterium]MBT4173126.1 glycosyltransferase [Candidatus Neomarinimicrobiota bacterium]
MTTLSICFFIIASIYFVGLLAFIIGNTRKEAHLSVINDPFSVSVIVAIRDGAGPLPVLLRTMSTQTYKGKLEFIIVDDESSDDTAGIIQSWAKKDSRFLYVSSLEADDQNLRLKKRTLTAGIEKASGDILLFTDADCHMGPCWIQSMAGCFSQNVDYVIGYAETHPSFSVVSRFQNLDLMMLMAGTRGITRLGSAWASTGQNQAYRKSLFFQTGGFSKISDFLQGDDSLFLQITRKFANSKVIFNSDPHSFITGRTEEKWGNLLRQRIRWAGDSLIIWRFNKIFFLYILSVFITNALLLISFTGMFPFIEVLSIILIKFCLEFTLFNIFTGQIKVKRKWTNFVYWFVLQIPYIVLMGVMSFIASKFSWRGRQLS